MTRLPDGVAHPNFFIVGAPKSGTSAMHQYLGEHPDCFMCRKEPHYFATDFNRGVDSPAGYAALFRDCPTTAKAVGEASVWYLYSREAIPNILHHLPDARIIAMLRNPVDLVHSKHAQMIFNCEEDVEDFEAAWRLESARRKGAHIPRRVPNPSYLYYSQVGRLGEQVDRLLSLARAGQVKLIVFDDFRDSPRRVYEETLDFLDLPRDARTEFPRVNANTVHRSSAVGRLLHKPPRTLHRLVKGLERGLGMEQLPGIDFMHRLNTREQSRTPLSPAFRAELVAHFREDVQRLEAVLDRDLSDWKR